VLEYYWQLAVFECMHLKIFHFVTILEEFLCYLYINWIFLHDMGQWKPIKTYVKLLPKIVCPTAYITICRFCLGSGLVIF